MVDQKYSEADRWLATSQRLFFVIVLVVCLGCGHAFSQNQPDSTPKAADIVTYLTETISWYRGTTVEQQIANEPSDVTFLNENRRISGGIVRLAFDFARRVEQNEFMQPKGKQTQEEANVLPQNQRLIQAMA